MSLDLLIPLVAGHLVGDFVLQTGRMVRTKNRPGVVFVHCVIVAVCSWTLTGRPEWWWIIPVVGGTHFIIDLAKARAERRLDVLKARRPSSPVARNGRVVLFGLDQVAHLGVIVALVLIAGETLSSVVSSPPGHLAATGARVTWLRFLVLGSGWILVASASGYFLALLLRRFEDELTENQRSGLTGGGYWIGMTERTLIYLFILAGEPAGIGFLAAAKSVFRIGELRNAEDRKLAEYILIGTLMSFALAMVIGMLVVRVVS